MKLIDLSNRKYIFILGIICLIEIVSTGILPWTKGIFFQALEDKTQTVWLFLGYMGLNYLILELVQSFKGLLVIRSAQEIRRGTSQNLLKFVTNLTSGAQRLQEDVKIYFTNKIQVYSEYFISFGCVVMLVGLNIHQPILLLGALAYAGVTITINKIFSPMMRKAEQIVQQSETELRDDIRENLQLNLLENTIACNLTANKIRFQYTLWSKFQSLLLVFLPYIVLTPLFLKGNINLGEFMSASSTFSLIALNASIIIQLFSTYTVAQASRERVEEMQHVK